jgi:amino acid transporter
MATREGGWGTDQAALIGAAVAAFVALIAAEGAFGAISTILGLTLAAILIAYYRVRDWPENWWDAAFKAAAVATVAALGVILIVAYPVQEAFVRHSHLVVDHKTLTTIAWCQTQVKSLSARDVETCIGGQTAVRFLWWMWALAAAIIFFVALYPLTRNVKDGPGGLDLRAVRSRARVRR